MSRALQVWDQRGGGGAFVVLWPLKCGGHRILWLDGPRPASFDKVGKEFEWDGDWWKRIA